MGIPYQAHSETSFQAAAEIELSASTLRGKCYRYIIRCGKHGATDEEIQVELKMNPSTQRPRRVELQERGLIVDSGFVRPTIAGRMAVVWVASDFQPAKKTLLTVQPVQESLF